jgi:hypothetical protein
MIHHGRTVTRGAHGPHLREHDHRQLVAGFEGPIGSPCRETRSTKYNQRKIDVYEIGSEKNRRFTKYNQRKIDVYEIQSEKNRRFTQRSTLTKNLESKTMTPTDLFNLQEGIRLKEEGMALAADNSNILPYAQNLATLNEKGARHMIEERGNHGSHCSI